MDCLSGRTTSGTVSTIVVITTTDEWTPSDHWFSIYSDSARAMEAFAVIHRVRVHDPQYPYVGHPIRCRA